MGGKGSGRKPGPKAPPGLATTPEELKARVTTPRAASGKFAKKDPEPEPVAVDFPVEALTLIHGELWKGIAAMARSSYTLSEDAAREMGELSSLVLKQYLGPALAGHAPLGAYVFTQLSAIVAVITTRQAKPAKPQELPKPAAKTEEPKPQYTDPPVVRSFTGPGAA